MHIKLSGILVMINLFELNSVESIDFSFSQLLKIVFKRIYRIYGRLFLFLVIFIFKTKKHFHYKFYRFCRFYRIQFWKTRFSNHFQQTYQKPLHKRFIYFAKLRFFLYHHAGRALTSDWSANSFIMTVYENFLLCFSYVRGPSLISFFEILKFSIIGNFVK